MTVDAVIPLARASREVPVTAHAPMGAARVIAVLGAMALRAEADGLAHGHGFPGRETEARRLCGIVTGDAGIRPVPEDEACVRAPGAGSVRLRPTDHVGQRVADPAADADACVVGIANPARERGQ